MNRPDAFIFDIYGTLIDMKAISDERAWTDVCAFLTDRGAVDASAVRVADLHRSVRRDMRSALKAERGGHPELDERAVFCAVGKALGAELSGKDGERAYMLFRAASTEYIRPFPGTAELLGELKARGKKLYVLSNAQAFSAREELKSAGLDGYFDFVAISSDYGVRKPDRRFFEALFRETGASAENSVMIGDGKHADVGAARAIGMRAVRTEGGAAKMRESILALADGRE